MKKLLLLAAVMLMAANVQAGLTEWEAAISGASPLHWYKFNEAGGTDCLDSGSGALNGTYDGVSLSEDGYFGAGTAAGFDRSGANRANFTGATELAGVWTVEYIVKTTKPPAGSDSQVLHDSDSTSIRLAGWTAIGEAGFTQYGVADYRFTPTAGLTLDDLIVQQDEWMHLVWRNDGSGTQLFFNGKLVGTSTSTITLPRLRIGGRGVGPADMLMGVLDEAVVYSRALTDADIIAHASAASLVDESLFRAADPSPPDGAIGWASPALTWTAGATAKFHDVYLSTSPDLGPADLVTTPFYQWNMYWHLAGFTAGATYYWRVDEVEADGTTTYTGDVWSFTAAPLTAYDPTPPDGAKFVDPDADLSWTPGTTAFSHDVYFGTDETEVTDGTGGTFKGNQQDPPYDPGPLANDTRYYWRIDEVEQNTTTKHTGEVWSFKTLPDIPISDPNLVGWWKFDAGQGTMAIDWSGHDNRGTLVGNPQWVAGYDGDALSFDGAGDSVNFGTGPSLDGTIDFTVAAWIKTSMTANGVIIQQRNGGYDGEYRFMITPSGTLDFMLYGGGYQFSGFTTASAVNDDRWHHAAAVRRGANGYIYVDGALVASTSGTLRSLDATIQTAVGADIRDSVSYFDGIIDDVRIYTKALTQEEIKQAMRGDPLLAWNPKPANGSVPDIDEAATLTWSPGDNVAKHDVYLGTDVDGVSDADTTMTGIYRGRIDPNSYTLPEGVEFGQTYYWRIDEYNTDATISMGRIWSFTVADYISVDDFDSYDDYCNRIFYTWEEGGGYNPNVECGILASNGNGTGSLGGYAVAPYAEQTITHDGSFQSMPLEIDNTASPFYSEAGREFLVPRNFTKQGVKALVLYVHGDSNSVPTQLYVGVEDSTGARKDVPLTDTSVVQRSAWYEWNIELSEFAPVNLLSVKKLFIGGGNRLAPSAGGVANVFIDDIRLYRPRCVASLAKPANDLNDDCVVNYADLQILTDNWLLSTYGVIPVDPGTANLVGHWTFDNAVDLGADSAGNNNGAPNGDAGQSANAKVGSGSLALDGDGDFVNVRGGSFFSALDDDGDGFTVAAWVQFAYRGQFWIMRVFSTDMSAGGSGGWGFGIIQPPARLRFTTYGIQDYDTSDLSSHLLFDQWVHVAAVYNSDGDADFYIDGSWAETIEGNFSMNDTEGFLIGALASPSAPEWFEGLIDDVRVYDTELSQGQLGWLAGKTASYNQDLSWLLTPRNPAINGYDDATIDLKDCAVLLDRWLDELLWP